MFKDIIPGYRIRPLSEKEQAEKVSQLVQRTRDWEQGLVSVYQTYLKGLEAEAKGVYVLRYQRRCRLTDQKIFAAKNELAEVALQSMCTLLSEATHFNFRVNLMSTIVSSLSRKSWDKVTGLCVAFEALSNHQYDSRRRPISASIPSSKCSALTTQAKHLWSSSDY